MHSLLRYGVESSMRLELAGDALVADCAAPRGQPLTDPRQAITLALADPMNFPPVAQAIAPGDRVVVTVDPDLPQPALVVSSVINALLGCGVVADSISVLRPRADHPAGEARLAEIGGMLGAGVSLVVHDPADRTQIAYLAATTHGRAIYLNRLLCDADLIIPLGCLRCGTAAGYHGAAGGLYPLFSDVQTHKRYRHPRLADVGSEPAQQARREIDEVSWLLGICFTVQIVPGRDGQILHVLAGSVGDVLRRGQELCDAAWSYSVPRRASLVVAAIEGDASEQSWENVGRALAAAAPLVDDEGAIAICSEVAIEPGPAVRRVATSDNPQATVRRLKKVRPQDTLAAALVAQALARARIYLLSRLDEAIVEDLGIAPVSEPAAIARLVQRHKSCIVLANAQRTVATPAVAP